LKEKTKGNLIEVIQEFAKKCTDKEGLNSSLWAVLTALRGPDSTSDGTFLKTWTTCRLRHIFGCRDLNCPAFVNPEPPTSEQKKIRDELLEKADRHFKTHFLMALNILRDYGYDVSEEEWGKWLITDDSASSS